MATDAELHQMWRERANVEWLKLKGELTAIAGFPPGTPINESLESVLRKVFERGVFVGAMFAYDRSETLILKHMNRGIE